MHFYYLDEAGCTGADLNNHEQPIFVLGGISVRDEGWINTQESYTQVIDEYFNGTVPQGFELHASDLLSPQGDGYFRNHDLQRRCDFARQLLNLLSDRSHDVHLYAIDKSALMQHTCNVPMIYNMSIPYLIAYDYMITYINWFVRERLGRSARGMLIIDVKEQFNEDIKKITHFRRFEESERNRVKWVVEFSYPVDSKKNPMIQLSDLVVFCTKKFLEIENGYRDDYPDEAKQFFAECYLTIHGRIPRKTIVAREEGSMAPLNNFLQNINSTPRTNWRRRYDLE